MEDNAELELFRRQWREEVARRLKPKASPTPTAAPTALPITRREKPIATPITKRENPIATWSMYPDLHDEVSSLLAETDLHLGFCEDDDEITFTQTRDTNIMGSFVCHNRACKSKGWSSKMIAITIRLYPGQNYNARVYHQRCRVCKSPSQPVLDQSYAERIVYWINKWNGVRVERPPVSNDSRGPHNRQLCEGCRAGHCSQSGEDWVAQLDRFVSPKPTHMIDFLTYYQVESVAS